MFSGLSDANRTFQALDLLRRRMDDSFYSRDEAEQASSFNGPPTNVYDGGASFRLEADLPGFAEKDVEIFVNQNIVTLRGERKLAVPEGYAPRRRERDTFKFERSFAFSARIDSDKVSAELKNGVLVVTLPKVAEAQPRQIAVKTA